MIQHIIDVLPFVLGTLILMVGPMKASLSRPITVAVLFTTAVYLVAQSSWFSALLAGDEWGRDWANYVWFIFNTSTMGIFLCILYCKK